MDVIPFSRYTHVHYTCVGLDRYQYRVSGISRYSPVLVGIGIGRYLFEYRCRYQ